MNPTLNIAVKAARKAGFIINRSSLDLERSNISSNLLCDYIKETIRLSEHAISEVLLNAYPDHCLVSKNDNLPCKKEFTWIVDALDGIDNFMHGFPSYAVSISLMQNNNIIQSVVYDPIRNELFTASKGGGTFLNDRRIRVSRKNFFDVSLISIHDEFLDSSHILDFLGKITEKSISIRKINSASLSLAYVACGRLEGFLGSNLDIFDMFSGGLLVSESGGLVADYCGEQNWSVSGQMLAATPKTFSHIINIMKKTKLVK